MMALISTFTHVVISTFMHQGVVLGSAIWRRMTINGAAGEAGSYLGQQGGIGGTNRVYGAATRLRERWGHIGRSG